MGFKDPLKYCKHLNAKTDDDEYHTRELDGWVCDYYDSECPFLHNEDVVCPIKDDILKYEKIKRLNKIKRENHPIEKFLGRREEFVGA